MIKHSNGDMIVRCEDVLYLLLEMKSLILLVFESHISYFICYLYSPYDSFQRSITEGPRVKGILLDLGIRLAKA